MKIGDKKEQKVVQFTGIQKLDVLACFDEITDRESERMILELERKKRLVNEAAKKRF